MNGSDLIKAGYKEYVDLFRNSDKSYQKRIRHIEDGKTLYFINVYEYDWSKYKKDLTNPISYEVDTCLYFDSILDQIRVQFNCRDMMVDQMEEYIEHMYANLYCVPDKYND